jgi:hypothetical protein
VRHGRKPRHVRADLTDDRPRGVLADAGDAHQPLAGVRERGGRLPDAGVQPGDHRAELVDVVQVQFAQHPVMGPETTLADLAAKGIVAEPPELPDGEDGPRTSWITDPDGYRIELVQWPAGHADGITEADFA